MQHIDNERNLRNLLITISYDGKCFHGWQIQQNAYTVQEAFQKAISKIIGSEFDLKGCSRTDSGVHANMYCLSVKTAHPIPTQRLKAALNRWLPLSIAAKARNISTKFGTARSEIRFWTATLCTTAIKSTKIYSTAPRRHTSVVTILHRFVLRTAASPEI